MSMLPNPQSVAQLIAIIRSYFQLVLLQHLAAAFYRLTERLGCLSLANSRHKRIDQRLPDIRRHHLVDPTVGQDDGPSLEQGQKDQNSGAVLRVEDLLFEEGSLGAPTNLPIDIRRDEEKATHPAMNAEA